MSVYIVSTLEDHEFKVNHLGRHCTMQVIYVGAVVMGVLSLLISCRDLALKCSFPYFAKNGPKIRVSWGIDEG